MRFARVLAGATVAMVATGCAAAFAPGAPGAPAPSCRQGDSPVRWALGGADRQAELDRWCAAVGTPALRAPVEAAAPPSALAEGPSAADAPWRRLVVISWNMNGPHGDLQGLLADLEAGLFGSGDAVVVLLQEAPRSDATVPAEPPASSLRGKWLGHDGPSAVRTADVARQARRFGLGLVYVPSMRNGHGPDDRGNAILSDLPVADPWSVELPLVRDRRVAVSAEIPAPGARRFRVTGLHLDHLAEWRRPGRSFGSARADQVATLLESLPWHDAGLLAGDFNAWHSQEDEMAVRLARRVYPAIETIPERPTVTALGGLARRRSDFLLARLPAGWRAEYRVWPHRYGSDHHPLVGVVETG